MASEMALALKAPVLVTRLMLNDTLSSARADASLTATAPLADTADSNKVSKSIGFTEDDKLPMPVPALMRKLKAYTAGAPLVSVSDTVPPAIKLTEPHRPWLVKLDAVRSADTRVSIRPKLRFLPVVAALKRTLPPLVWITFLSAPLVCMVTTPALDSTSTVPAPATVMSPVAPKVTSPAVATRLTPPPAVLTPADTLTPAPAPCSSKLPTLLVPVRATACVTLSAPTAVTTTDPLAALKPDWAASVIAVSSVPSLLTRLKLTAAAVPTSSALASATPTTPPEATALSFWTSISSPLTEPPNTPTPAPAFKRKLAAYTSMAALVSASSTEPPAITLTAPQLACPVKAEAVRSALLRASIRPSVTFLVAAAALTRTLPALV